MGSSVPLIYWVIAAAAISVRIFFYVYTPLIDNDSIVIFMAARELISNGVVSMVNTLPVLLTGFFYRIFGEHILWARLPQLLGGIGTILLLIISARKYGAVAGFTAGIIFAFLPIAILYGSIAKSYSLMVFLIFAGALVFDRAVEKQCAACSALSALLFILAFGCYTFAAISIFPITVFFLLSIFRKKSRSFLKPSLITGAVFAMLLGAVIAWRWKVFGWSVLNDYVTDWRFDLATRIWEARWVGLTDIWGVGIAFLIPGIIVLIWKSDTLRKQDPLIAYALIFIPVNVILWLVNPVNHFPRVLLPALPFLSLLIGLAIQRVNDEKAHWGTALAWIGTTLFSVAILYPRFNPGDTPFWFFTPETGSGISLSIIAVVLFFFFFLIILKPIKKVRVHWQHLVPISILLMAGTIGPVMTFQSVEAQARVFQSRARLVDAAGATGIMGGGDYQNLAHTGNDSVAWMLDLTVEEINQVLKGEILDMCRARGISHVIVARHDPDGVLDMLKVMAKQNGIEIGEIENVFVPLHDPNQTTRLIDNDFGTLYVIHNVTKNIRTTKQGQLLNAYHSPFELRPSLSVLSFVSDGKKVLYMSGKNDPSVNLQTMAGQIKLEETPVEPRSIEMPLDHLEKYLGENLTVRSLDSNGIPFREIGMMIRSENPDTKLEDAP